MTTQEQRNITIDNRKWEASAKVIRSANALKKAIKEEGAIGSAAVDSVLVEYNQALKAFKRLQR